MSDVTDAATIIQARQTSPVVSSEKTGDHIDRYQLLEELGAGGFGIVWRAEQQEPIHREVALKVIKPGMDSREVIARFEAERQALALMDHPNIAGVLDAGTTVNGRPYFVMELVRGVPVNEYCDQHKLTIRQRLELFVPVCQAVQHAHQKAILHRDLKPSNILVTEVDGRPVPKVIDFGIAKALGATQEAVLHATLARTQDGLIVGTPQYMSPEQAGSVPDLDTRSDIYTLGVILYELLTGQTPLPYALLRKAAIDEVLRLIREKEPVRPSSRLMPVTEAVRNTSTARRIEPNKLARALQGDLDWITLKALEKERERRYESASALAQDIERHLNNEPVEAGPPSAFYRLRKLVRRNRMAFGAAAVMAMGVAAGVVAIFWALLREQAARAQEAVQREKAEATLAELRKTAPTFQALVNPLVESGKFDEAIEKIGYAIRLDEKNADYYLVRGNLLEATQNLAAAAEDYRNVLSLRRGDQAAQTNLALCERLLAKNGGSPNLSREVQIELRDAIHAQDRPLEAALLNNLVGADAIIAWKTINARLKDYVHQDGWRPERLAREGNNFTLDLSNLTLGDLSILKDQPVTSLDLSATNVSDLSPLRSLALLSLKLGQTPDLFDLAPLAGIKLVHLDLDLCRGISDLQPLAEMPLETLVMSRTPIADLSPLASCTKLKKLIMTYTQVSDLEPLAGCTGLESLDAYSTRVTDLRVLANCPNLLELNIGHTPVSDLAPIGACTNLIGLDASSTNVSDITPLAGCISLKRLFLSNNTALRDIAPLTELRLTALDIQDTNVTDLTPLRNHPLEFLALPRSVDDLGPIAGCQEIKEIRFCKVKNPEILRKFPKLQAIYCEMTDSKTQERFSPDQFFRAYEKQKAPAAVQDPFAAPVLQEAAPKK